MSLRKAAALFSYQTRHYLRRRVWRYFRRLGFRSRPSIVGGRCGFGRYRDDDLARGENILDSWTLLQICFRRSPVLVFKRNSVEVADGLSLAGLIAAPRFEELWKLPESRRRAVSAFDFRHSRLVRVGRCSF